MKGRRAICSRTRAEGRTGWGLAERAEGCALPFRRDGFLRLRGAGCAELRRVRAALQLWAAHRVPGAAGGREIARLSGAKDLMHLKVDLFRRIGGSALTDARIAVPEAAEDESEIGAEVPVTYVPFPQRAFSFGRGELGGGAGSAQRSSLARWSRTAPATPIAGRRTTTRSTS